MLDVTPEVMATAYRMSAEIADWLNRYAASHGIEAVELDGIRPTGIDVTESPDAAGEERRLRATWPNVTRIDHRDVWSHKGVEYDAVLVDPTGMPPSEVYLAASRAAHELVVAIGAA